MRILDAPHLDRRAVFKLSTATAAAAAISASLAACGTVNQAPPTQTSTADPNAPQGNSGTIKAGISYELGTNGYDPMTTTSALTVAVNWHTMEGLTEIHPATREVYAALAADLPTQENDTTWVASLREGATFHNGDPVSADDVVFSFERILDEANNSLYAGFLEFIDQVTARDDQSVEITTKYPFSLVPERLAVAKVVSRKAVEAGAEQFDMNPVGTGPWRMTDNGAGSQLIAFERFDEYTGPLPARADTMTWQILPDTATRTNALSSSTVDAVDAVAASDLGSLTTVGKQVAAEQGFGLLFLMFNCGSAPMDDVRNRQAVLHALNYDQITKVGMSQLAAPATCFVHEDHPTYKEAKHVYAAQNLEEAKRLLGETGLKQVRLLSSDHGWFESVRPMVRESLEAAGLSVSYSEKKSSDVYSTIDGVPEAFDIVMAPGDPSIFGDDADLLLRWWYSGDTWTDSRMHWKGSESHAKVQELLDQGVRATGDEQIGIWHQIYDLISEEVPLYPIFHRRTPTAWDETLQGFEPLAVTGLSFLDVSLS